MAATATLAADQDGVSVVATMDGAGWACPGLTNFAQHSEQNTSILPELHFSYDGPISKHE